MFTPTKKQGATELARRKSNRARVDAGLAKESVDTFFEKSNVPSPGNLILNCTNASLRKAAGVKAGSGPGRQATGTPEEQAAKKAASAYANTFAKAPESLWWIAYRAHKNGQTVPFEASLAPTS